MPLNVQHQNHRRSCWVGLRLLAVALAACRLSGARAEEPLALSAIPSFSVDGLTLLLDPVEYTPIAIAQDPDGRLAATDGSAVLQTQWSGSDSPGLPQLRLGDVHPEYWAQPAVWETFVRGPEVYSGWGTELRARDWAGMPMTDRRSYRLDPGLRATPTPSSTVPPGVGSIRWSSGNGSGRLTWTGLAGRVYQVFFATDLNQPFRLLQSSIAAQDGEMSVVLPSAGPQGFYRLAEVRPSTQ